MDGVQILLLRQSPQDSYVIFPLVAEGRYIPKGFLRLPVLLLGLLAAALQGYHLPLAGEGGADELRHHLQLHRADRSQRTVGYTALSDCRRAGK